MINQRLFDHHGIDTEKNLKIDKRCARPFDTILIDKRGSCFVCECQSWLPQSVGNLQLLKLSEILGSSVRRAMQESVSDGTYRYCNQDQCSYIRNGYIDDTPAPHLKNLRLAIDDSCNLRCPSCRKGMIFHKDGPNYDLGMRLADRVIEWLDTREQPITVHIGSDGDPFASQVYRYFMDKLPKKKSLKYSILTNGLLFKEFHYRIPHVLSNLLTMGVSVDGASAETYEKLRLGGKWQKILDALDFIGSVKNTYHFKYDIHMVVQQDNHHEIDRMVELCIRYGVDRLYLNQIQDWHTGIDFKKQTFTSNTRFNETVTRVLRKYHWKAKAGLVVQNNISLMNE